MMIECQAALRERWVTELRAAGFDLDIFPRLQEGQDALNHLSYEALFITKHLPDGDGIEWLRKRRRAGITAPIIAMIPSEDVESRIRALDAGADDAIQDQLDPRELVARMRAILRRQPILRPDALEAGRLRLDLATREVTVGHTLIDIPRRELSILQILLQCFNRTVTRGHLESAIYGINGEVCPNSIEVRISRLRRCLEPLETGLEIKTVRGIGYRLQLVEQTCEIPHSRKSRKREAQKALQSYSTVNCDALETQKFQSTP